MWHLHVTSLVWSLLNGTNILQLQPHKRRLNAEPKARHLASTAALKGQKVKGVLQHQKIWSIFHWLEHIASLGVFFNFCIASCWSTYFWMQQTLNEAFWWEWPYYQSWIIDRELITSYGDMGSTGHMRTFTDIPQYNFTKAYHSGSEIQK